MKNKILNESQSDKNKFFNHSKSRMSVKDMVATANDLQNVGTDENSVQQNNNWDGNLYTYSFNRLNK